MNTKIYSLRWLHVLIIVAVCGVGFISQYRVVRATGTSLIQVLDANGTTVYNSSVNDLRLLAGGVLNVYVRVTNTGSTALSSVSLTSAGTCAGVSSITINPSSDTISTNSFKVYTIQIVANSTVTTGTCTAITISDNTTVPVGSLNIQFNIGPAAVATATPVLTATRVVSPTSIASGFCSTDNDPGSNLQWATIVVPDLTYNQGICNAGDVDAFAIALNRDKVYNMEVTQADPGLDLIMELYDPLFRLVAVNDDFYEHNSASSSDINPQIPDYRAPMDGVYYLRIRDATGYGGSTAGTYSFKVSNQSYGGFAPINSGVCIDKYEPDGLPEQARLILSNQRQNDHRLCPVGDADWVMFFAKSSNTYYLYTDTRNYLGGTINSQLPGTDTVMTLVDRDGVSFIANNDNVDGTSFDSQIRFQPASDGFYFLQIKNTGDIGSADIKYDLVNELCLPGRDTCGRTNGGVQVVGSTETPTPSPTPNLFIETTPTIPDATQAVFIRANMQDSRELFNGPLKNFIDKAFELVWNRSDRPIARQQVTRSWLWGPTGLMARAEGYLQMSGGLRQVQYFDKGRMEINNPNGNRQSPWFVTSGLLVRELISGNMQVGNNEFINRESSDVPLAGDPGDTVGPTYASFANIINTRSSDRTAATVDQRLMRDGSVVPFSGNGIAAATIAKYIPETGHNIPQVFFTYLTKNDVIYVNGRTTQGRVMDWIYTMGYPISEAYWTRATIAGVEQWVLVQPFERRVLTYVPNNPAGWQVEQGNVGRHYYRWRYGAEPTN